MSRRRDRGRSFAAIRCEGGLLPDDFLQRLAAGDRRVIGLEPAAYHLGRHERIGEMVSRSWSRLLGSWRSFRDALAVLPPGDPALRLTRERWLLPLFQELGYGRLVASPAVRLSAAHPLRGRRWWFWGIVGGTVAAAATQRASTPAPDRAPAWPSCHAQVARLQGYAGHAGPVLAPARPGTD